MIDASHLQEGRVLRALIEASLDVVALLDERGVVEAVTPSTATVLGIASSALVGSVLSEHLPPSERAAMRDALLLAGAGGDRVTITVAWKRGLAVQRTLRVVVAGNGAGSAVVVMRDVTEEHDLVRRALLAQRVEAVGRLAGGVAHDYNNLLTVISGNAQLLLSGATVPPGARPELEEIVGAARRAARLTQHLLAFSRQQVLRPAAVDLNTVVTDAEDLLRDAAGTLVTVEVHGSRALDQVWMDRGQMEQVLLQLVKNAGEALGEGGRVVVRLENAAVNEAVARRHAPMPPGRYVRMTVTDTGPGMDEGVRLRVFEPFFTTRGQGRGLGLAMVYGVVKQSGGFIWVDSHTGKGAEFSIFLPALAASAAAPVLGARAAAVKPAEASLLVVEDEDAVRTVLERCLKRAGFRVYVAANGDEGMKLVQSATAIDLILSDIVMPGMNGIELCAQVKRMRPGLPVLLMSGYTKAREALANADESVPFLQKPFRLEELLRRIRSLLAPSVTAHQANSSQVGL